MHELLKQGIRVVVADTDPSPQPSPTGRGGQRIERVRVIDWENPEANDFLLVSQMSMQGPLYLRRPDLIGFVNGLPLVVGSSISVIPAISAVAEMARNAEIDRLPNFTQTPNFTAC